MSKRRKYSIEFKRGAVEQIRRSGVSCAQVARELGIGANLLTRWKQEAEGPKAAFGGTGTPRDEELSKLGHVFGRVFFGGLAFPLGLTATIGDTAFHVEQIGNLPDAVLLGLPGER